MLLKLFEDTRDGDINPNDVLKNQARFKSDLREIKIGCNKSPNQKNTIMNITDFLDLREKIIHFFRDYFFLLSEARYKAKYGAGFKIFTPKKMLQRLPIKAGNNSKTLFNEIRQIVYSLYQ